MWCEDTQKQKFLFFNKSFSVFEFKFRTMRLYCIQLKFYIMNAHKRDERFREYRTWPKWYYHIVFDSIEKGQLFNNNDEYADGMNGVALGQYIHGLAILAFVLMVNHCHFLVLGSGESIVEFFLLMKRRINRRLKADGFPPLPENYGFKLVRVENEKQLADTIIYIARNPLKACPNIVSGGYLWCSTNLIFSDMNCLVEKIPIKELSYRKSMKTFRTKVRLPEDYMFNPHIGFVLPESYVLTDKVEKVLRNSWRFTYNLVKNIDAYVRIAEGVGDMVVLSEEELNDIIYQSLKEKFNASSVSALSIDDRCRLAVILKKKYRVDTKRIARKIQVEVSVLNKLFE